MARIELAAPYGAGRRTFELSGSTVRQILENLGDFPTSRVNLLGTQPFRYPFESVFLNDVDITLLPLGEDTPVGPDDRVRVVSGIWGEGPEAVQPLPALTLDSATLNITLSSPRHSVSDVAWLVNSVDNLAMACIWGLMQYQGFDDETLRWARVSVLEEVSTAPYALGRFFPNLPQTLLDPAGTAEFIGQRAFYPEFNPFDALDAGVQTGLNTMLRRVLVERDRTRYERLFSFAEVRRLEHHSPLILETIAVLGAAAALPAVLFYGCMKAVYSCRRAEVDVGIREAELALKQEELRQSKIRTQVQQHLAAAIAETKFTNGPVNVPEAVMAETARIATTSVADLGGSPLIGSITLGLSKGK